MTHMHITTWVVALILFFIAMSMDKSSRGFKILHMIVRVFYVLIILTGFALIGSAFDVYWLKAIVGIIVIGMMEMILVRAKKGKSTGALWIVFIIAFLVVLYMGLALPQGFQPFG
ncbi:DUF1516 family protein [Peribacillus cavernae]|uniref:UPF0344 protein ELQ35_06500 n=1 Tax=Peribacillus cavernae TaxID=1674310 RepID=A0A433HNV4_9BACI|nr:YisL family protein [Peribacillus cavernae]MDQ0217565.1 putative membrane protein SirB2 [Peribacillus cavernae]RUQ30001.1 DUF1516 family protein [Peribacillus cavernae]